jgi:hypothetical protein
MVATIVVERLCRLGIYLFVGSDEGIQLDRAHFEEVINGVGCQDFCTVTPTRKFSRVSRSYLSIFTM